MNGVTEELVTIAGFVAGIAILSVLVSRKSNTSGVIQAAASGYGNLLATAMSPVTGANVTVNNSYPTAAGSYGSPTFNYGSPTVY